MKYFTWNRNNSRAKIQTMIVCSFIFFISACATTFDIDEQKVLGPVSEHQKIFIVKYDTPQKWLDYNDVRDEMFSKWILNGFTELLNKNDIDADGTVLTKENKKADKKQIKLKMKALQQDGVLVIKPKSAHGLMDSSSGISHQIEYITYKFEFFSYKSKKKVKVWESSGNYHLPNVMYADDPEKLYHAYSDVFVNEVLTKLQEAGFIKPITLFETK